MKQQPKNAKLQPLDDYIKENYNNNQSEFGRSISPPVSRALVNQWLKLGYYVADGKLLSVRRVLGDDC